MTIQTGYTIANIAAIKALTSSQRTNAYTRQAQSDASGNPAWYTFLSASIAAADDDLVLMPNDNPGTGRWHKNGGAGGSIISFGGQIICTSQCSITAVGSGKAFQFYAPQANLKLKIVPGFDISVTSGIKSIQLHKWNQEPNTGLSGRQFVAEMPNTGGEATITIDNTYRWISVFAKNPANSGQFDGVCFVMNGNTITLMGYS